jgi:acyl-CoA reductase-like NAD-dependent aldehyde dehydrogenase
MALMDEEVWRGKIYSGGRASGAGGDAAVIEPATGLEIPVGGLGASGTGARFGGTSNLEAFTDTRWVTIRGDIAPYPF